MKTHHINRATGVPRYLRENHRIPVARVNKNNEIKFFRYYELSKSEYYQCYLYNILRDTSHTFNYILGRNDFLLINWKEAIDITTLIFDNMRTTYKKLFNGNFYLLFRETGNIPTEWKCYLESKLFDYNLKYTFEPNFILLENKVIHPYNTHPNSEYNKWSAMHLIDEFKL